MTYELSPEDAAAVLKLLLRVTSDRFEHFEKERHRYDWRAVARPKQLAPGTPGAESQRTDWRYWFLMCGRGFGKTRTGAEWVREQVREGRRRRIAFIAPTLNDGRKIMIEGVSGILNVSPPDERPVWVPAKRELHWPNGAMATLYTTEEPERLRGDEHDAAWCEELGAWRNAKPTWSNLRMMMRLRSPKGDAPQFVITTTPRPTDLIREIIRNPGTEVINGTTYENKANLDQDFVSAVLEEYEGTRLGAQELLGQLLTDTPGALWKLAQIEELRVRMPPELSRVVVAVDPAVADADERRAAAAEDRVVAETGIVVAGIGRCMCDGKANQHGFVLDDLSGYMSPDEWAKLAIGAYSERKADRFVAEINNGGALVEALLRTIMPNLSYRGVYASRGKISRAEPVANLYERRMIHHAGTFAKLEDQMTTYNPLLSRKSPDRMDAAVWGFTDLMLGPKAATFPTSLPSGGVTPKRRI